MAYGLQVFDSSGNTILDTGDRITRIVTIISVNVSKNSPVFIAISGMSDDGTWGSFATGLAVSTVGAGGVYVNLAYASSATVSVIVFRF